MRSLLLLVVLEFMVIKHTTQMSLNEELTLSYKQKLTLDKFREMMTPLLPHDYMKEEIYLIKWLRVKEFDIKAAEKMLLENLKWRKENDMDNILKEDWSEFDNEYRFGLEGCDREGRPVVSIYIGDWDIRKAVLQGNGRRLMRYVNKLHEEAANLIRALQKKGYIITQYDQIFDMAKINPIQHGCPQCIPIILYAANTYEQHYPLSVHNTYHINAPNFLQTLLRLVQPFQSRVSRETAFIFGYDKKEWIKGLTENINENNLSNAFGGNRDEPLDFSVIRQNISAYTCDLS